MRAHYETGYLTVGGEYGAFFWLLQQASDWWVGPALGPAFTDAVYSGWSQWWPEMPIA